MDRSILWTNLSMSQNICARSFLCSMISPRDKNSNDEQKNVVANGFASILIGIITTHKVCMKRLILAKTGFASILTGFASIPNAHFLQRGIRSRQVSAVPTFVFSMGNIL